MIGKVLCYHVSYTTICKYEFLFRLSKFKYQNLQNVRRTLNRELIFCIYNFRQQKPSASYCKLGLSVGIFQYGEWMILNYRLGVSNIAIVLKLIGLNRKKETGNKCLLHFVVLLISISKENIEILIEKGLHDSKGVLCKQVFYTTICKQEFIIALFSLRQISLSKSKKH